MNEFLEQFLIESRELIEQATENLLVLEHHSTHAESFDSAFRAIHTLKGAAGIMDFDAMAQLCHAAEDVLSAVRAGAQAMTPALVTVCLACLDQIAAWLATMEERESLPELAKEQAARLISQLLPGGVVAVAAPMPTPQRSASAAGKPGISAYAADVLHEQVELLALPRDQGTPGREAAAMKVIGHILGQPEPSASEPPASAASETVKPGHVEASTDATASSARPMRSDMARIDALMRLCGELVVVKNALGHSLTQTVEAELTRQRSQDVAKIYGQLDRLTTDLVYASVAARVLPVRQVFQRFPRLVREMAAGVNKKIRLVTEGDATEADRQIIEALFEPVLHVLRNAVDHGVEPSVSREASGKPIPAIIRLTAARIGDEVVIEIVDDGRGIDPAAIRATAESRGVASAQALAEMSGNALLELIFEPGFSTAAAVSNLSGRGVGMDAVRTAIVRLGGRVGIESRLGAGTTIRFHLPFTVLLTQVLNVEVHGQTFGIPFEAVAETLQIPRLAVVRLGAAETVLWRGQTLPLISLAEALRQPNEAEEDVLQIVAIEHDGGVIALKVDRFGKRMEVMLKPLEGLLTGVQGVTGTALLGDGRVLIVLELQELLK